MKKFLLLALVALSGLTSNLVYAINYATVSNSAAIQNDINNLLLAYNGQNPSDPNCFANQASSLATQVDLYHKTSPLNTALLAMYNSAAWQGVNNALSTLSVNIIKINNITPASVASLITNANSLVTLVTSIVNADGASSYSQSSQLLQYAQTIVKYANQLQADLANAKLTAANQKIFFNIVNQTYFLIDNFLNPSTGAFLTPTPLTYNQVAHSNDFTDFNTVNSNQFIQSAIAIYRQINGQASAVTCAHINQLNQAASSSIPTLTSALNTLMTALNAAINTTYNAIQNNTPAYYVPNTIPKTNPNETLSILHTLYDNIEAYTTTQTQSQFIQLPNYASQLSQLAASC